LKKRFLEQFLNKSRYSPILKPIFFIIAEKQGFVPSKCLHQLFSSKPLDPPTDESQPPTYEEIAISNHSYEEDIYEEIPEFEVRK